jgi:hypothetical protein
MSARRNLVTVTEAIWVDRPPEAVFDYTQDYTRRTEWDPGISEASVLTTSPRTARVTVPGLGRMTVLYRLDRRPERTSAEFQDIESRWVTGGGGSWRYEPEAGGTRWTETNTLELRPTWLMRLLVPVIAWNVRRSTRRAMAEAKRRLEAESAATSDAARPA